jgi:copper chaperone CopZ
MKTSLLQLILIGFIALSMPIASAQAFNIQESELLDGEVTQGVRNKEVAKQLKGTTNTVFVYAKGMCCPSCSSGVKKHIGELDFVEKTQGDKSIQIDAEHQLVRIALKARATIDMKALSQALGKAGFPAVHLYELKAGKVITKVFPKGSSKT